MNQNHSTHGSGAAGAIPVTILTGFLGAGKTTLLNHILTVQHGMRIAVIENEFGEVDVDSDLVLASDEEIFQMTNGCICCVVDVRTDLVRILQTLLARPEKFDHILVETSGLADPTPVAATFFMDHDVARQLRLDGVVTLVDALHIAGHLDDPALVGMDNQAVDQIVAADRIIVNKIDLVDTAAVPALERRLRAINQGAQILRSCHAHVDLEQILGIGGFDSGVALIDPHFLDGHDEHADHASHAGHACDEHCDHAGHAASADPEGVCGLPGNGPAAFGHAHDPSVDSVSLTFAAPFDRRQLDAWLARLLQAQGDDLFRLKGILAIQGEQRRHVLQAVHRVMDLRPADAWPAGAPRLSKLVFIGRNLDRDTLKAGLDWCLAAPAGVAALLAPSLPWRHEMDQSNQMAQAVPRLVLRGIRKVYPAVVANDGVDLSVMPGEIHAVLGENGAGKSTLMKVIYGVTQPSGGDIVWEGQRVRVASPAHARSLGIGMVFQHFSLFDTLTVVENVALSLPGEPDLAGLASRIRAVSERYGLPVDPCRLAHGLSVGERQRVEIIRCLLQNPRLLIMDEPTSVLTPQAVRTLFTTLRQLAGEGCSILYISHKLDEIKSLCHCATILRAGKVAGGCIPADESLASMARLMIGKELTKCSRGAAAAQGDVRLSVHGLSLPSQDPFGVALKEIRLDVRAGEILGIAGISGNGQQELLAALSGEVPLACAQSIEVCGTAAGRLAPGQRRALGLCFVPEERLGRGAVPRMSLARNGLLTAYGSGLLRYGLIRFGAMRELARHCIEKYQVKCGGPEAQAHSLSGGNLQKFIVGREIMQCPKVLIVAQPTWGVDVGAAAFIRQALLDLRGTGTAVLVISEELDELFEIADRIAVIAGGRLSPATPTGQTSMEEIGVRMSGVWHDDTVPADPADPTGPAGPPEVFEGHVCGGTCHDEPLAGELQPWAWRGQPAGKERNHVA